MKSDPIARRKAAGLILAVSLLTSFVAAPLLSVVLLFSGVSELEHGYRLVQYLFPFFCASTQGLEANGEVWQRPLVHPALAALFTVVEWTVLTRAYMAWSAARQVRRPVLTAVVATALMGIANFTVMSVFGVTMARIVIHP